MTPRFKGQNCKFFTTPLSRNFQKRLERKENQTKYRKMTRKPRSYVRLLIYRTWAIRRRDELYQWSRRCVRGADATQAMSAFHLPNKTLMISGIIKRKCNDIVLLKQRFQPHRNAPLAFRPKFWLLLSKVGLETKIFGSGTGSFSRTGPTVQEDHLWRWTILTGIFPRRPKRPIYFSTKSSENFGVMESTLCNSWWLKEVVFRAEPSCIL